ncbi:MAG TPA: SusC/RagA family TonB-linked outer membrane protein [Gemmatimonadales bacterium]|nr:SusC/RagA family TonB-linked outer membrane protein [Gemmatimonadales bacterium]
MKWVRYGLGALLVALVVGPLWAQEPTGTIRGVVTDSSTDRPLQGATVFFGTHSTLTLPNGSYVLNAVPAVTDSLRVRMIGYAPGGQSVTVEAGQVLTANFTLAARATTLSEIVAVGYGQQRAGNISGAVSTVTSDEFNPGQIVTPQALIQGKVAGVQVVDNNEPGGGLSIRIRGATSVNASSDPLYVVDGMPVGYGGGLSDGRDPLNFINPDDIESITVLKDASAAAIYGANAANGVVLITTKKGRRHGPEIEYSTSLSSSSVTRLPAVLNASQFRAAVAQFAPSKSASLGNANTDWFSEVDRSGFGQQHNVVVSGAGESSDYRFSVGYLKQNGILQNSSTERVSLGLTYNQSLLKDNLSLQTSVRGSRSFDQFQASDVLGNAVSMAPTQPVFDSTNPTGYWDWPTTGASASNPVASLRRTTNQGTTWRSVGNVLGIYHLPFFPSLSANINLGYDLTQTNNQLFIPNDLAAQIRQGQGMLSLTSTAQTNQVLETYLNYAAPLRAIPGNIDVTGGYSYTQSHSAAPSFQETGLSSNLLGINGVPSAVNIQNSTYVVDYKLISFFGRLNYNLNDRYILAASVRRDGSSRFGPGNQWGTFPSVSLAWRLSQESFLKNVSWVSDLKLRASWARTGNQAFADYSQYPTYSYSNNLAQYYFDGQFITTIRPNAVDPNIHWESTSSKDVGLDYALFNQRISGAFDWYTKDTKDLIFTVPVAAGTNFSNLVTTNIGTMRNRGFEFSLNARILDPQDGGLSYSAAFVVSHNANTLLSINPNQGATQIDIGSIGGGTGNTIQVLQAGYPVNSFLVCRQFYQNGKPVENTYYSLVQNAAGDSTVQGCTNNARPYHSPWPTLELGHTSSFTYHRFDLSFTLRAQLGNYVYNNVAASNGSYQNITSGNVTPTNMDASVLKTGFMAPQYLSDYYVENASFLRMDNITLGYSFQYGGRPWRAYATIQNAFTITGYSGVDPTAGLNGIDNNIYPRSRTYLAGLSVRF